MKTAAAVAAVLALATGCVREPTIQRVPQATGSATPTPSVVSVSPPPKKLASGRPSPSCVNGWKEPAPGSALRKTPLDLLRKTQGFDKEFHVVDLRHFTGPDDANLAPGSKQKSVDRWYGHVVYTGDPDFQLRFLAVKRDIGTGVVAIADASTSGFQSPDWYGFDGEGGKTAYPGLPGKWPGTPYDYVQAKELPPEVRGCLTPRSS
jgi:hypothetical protein